MLNDQSQRYRLDKLSILVLDANRHMRSIIRTMLKGFGVRELFETETPADAFDRFRTQAIDIAITELDIAGTDGRRFVKMIRSASESPNPYLPIIMMSAEADTRNVAAARDAGVNAFLAKPVSANQILDRITWLIQNPRPYVRSPSYFGPDRRRRNVGPPHGMTERRMDALAAA